MHYMRLLCIITVFIIAFIVNGCVTFNPSPDFAVPFRERAQSKIDGEVRVTAAVLSAEESRQVFGVNLAGKGIQPVWIRVQNADTTHYWMSSTALDPDYFSPHETAYAFHGWFAESTNRKIDEHFNVLSFRNPIAAGTSVSGFVYVNLDEGTKVVDIDLISGNGAKFITFFITVPGIKADYHEVDFDTLYTDDVIVNYTDAEEFRAALYQLPCCTTNEDGTETGDPLNLVFIGSREDISAAFARRGWLTAEQTYGRAIWKTIRSFLFGTRYRYSPVSPLYLYGRQQDFAGQKPRHTVHQRNHLRVWLSPMRFQGNSVWIGQISRDIGVRFTFSIWPPVTHKIDPDIDEAQTAFLEDLIYSQQISKVGWIKGSGAASRSKPGENLTGDPYFTDGYLLVLMFDRRPHSLANIDLFNWDNPISYHLKRLETYQDEDFDEH